MKKLNRTSTGKIRIIGGQWRGRKLPVLNSPGLRPTPDRIRETLFNWLSPLIVNARCLDCFSGSGALGLESLSRYAASATLLEIKHNVAKQLQRNLAMLKATNATVINTNTLSFLSQPGSAYNIVFIDPPFRKNLLNDTLFLLTQNGWLKPTAIIYIESEVKNSFLQIPIQWTLYREKVAGRVVCQLYVQCIRKEYDVAN